MKMIKTAAFAAVTVLALVGCQQAGQPSEAEIDAIKAVNGAWADHYNSGDAGALAGVTDVMPAFRSLTVCFDPARLDPAAIALRARARLRAGDNARRWHDILAARQGDAQSD